jgi:hypothetical protein
MKNITLLICVCLFINCDYASKRTEAVKNTSEQDMLFVASETSSTVQVISNDAFEKSVNGQDIEVAFVELLVDERKGMIISKDWAILYLEYNKEFELWYKPHIINFNTKDTVRIAGFCYDDNDCYDGSPQMVNGGCFDYGECYSFGSHLSYNVSPNLRYVLLDNVNIGFMDDGTLHGVHKCILVDIKKAKLYHRMQGMACGLQWNNKNNYGNTIFVSEKYEKHYLKEN